MDLRNRKACQLKTKIKLQGGKNEEN